MYNKLLIGRRNKHKTRWDDDTNKSASIRFSDERKPLIDSKKREVYGSQGATRQSHRKKDVGEIETAPSIILCLWRLCRWELMGAMVLNFLYDINQLANPLLLNELISFSEQPEISPRYGFALAGTMFFALTIRSILFNNYFRTMFNVGVKFQTFLTAAVYAKVLLNCYLYGINSLNGLYTYVANDIEYRSILTGNSKKP